MSSLKQTMRIFAVSLLYTGVAGALTLTCPSRSTGKDFHGQTIVRANFGYQDLTNANFSGAILAAPFFVHANLTGANFQDAVFVNDGSNSSLVADFSFANLQDACFIGTQFNGPTYLTNANLTCADFSRVDLTNGNAIFGESPLQFDRSRTACRPAFRSSIMTCEFLRDWPLLDLSSANIRACLNELAGRDFTSAKMPGVDLTGALLDNAKFVGADLTKAILNRASLQNVDLSYATLFGGQLNNTNLTGASLYGVYLANDHGGNIINAASVRHSHLKNVNLSSAHLSGVDFTYSNFYGEDPAQTGGCKIAPSRKQCDQPASENHQGFTCNCASAHGAIMTETKFDNAYLYGVDFTNSRGQAVDFHQAVLTGSNFSGAELSSNAQGVAASLSRAFLQGANLEGALLNDTPNLTDAFLDFSVGGNNIYIFLDGVNHNQFTCPNCKPASGSDVCVVVNYPRGSNVPSSAILTCPDGRVADCGPDNPTGRNPSWKSRLNIESPPSGVPPAWYENDATYTTKPVNPGSICKGAGAESAILFW